ncbi:glycosyltransferase family protein [Desulfocurvus sp. DL9XJH121]
MPSTPLAVVILHYGDPDLTRRLADQIEAGDRAAALVLDNAAPEPYPGAWERLPENLYWAGAFQWAMERLAGEGCERVWFLNNDLYFVSRPPFGPRILGRLARMERSLGRVGICSPAVTASPYHPQMVRRAGVQFSRVGLLDGIAPLVHVDAWREAGGLDFADNPFGYGVDLDFSLRVARAGWALAVDHEVCVRHVYHSTAGAVDGFMNRAAHAQDAYLAARHGEDWRAAMDVLKTETTDYEIP